MKKKFLSSILLLFTFIFIMVGCSSNDNNVSNNTKEDGVIQKIKSKGELTVLTNATFPPFEYMDGDEIKGVDIDIAKAIAEKLGVKLNVVNMDFDPIVDYIKNGRGDIGIAGMTENEKRKKAVDFSDKYITTKQYILIKKDVDENTFDPNDKVIGVQQGTTGDTVYASDIIKAKEVKRYKSSVDAVEDLKLGRIDCVIIDELPAKKLSEKNKDIIKSYDPKYEEESYVIIMKKDSKDLQELINEVIKEFKNSGKLEESIIKHTSNS